MTLFVSSFPPADSTGFVGRVAVRSGRGDSQISQVTSEGWFKKVQTGQFVPFSSVLGEGVGTVKCKGGGAKRDAGEGNEEDRGGVVEVEDGSE